ncbi:T9SS type A sorting domain-containing protein [Flavobacterium sp. 102]|uniref:T9SS type A sorting domain-containing protein n=1 Tax=Flavobacterium sp. 102 TaxID=2135623 RepID=UPI000EAED3C4|nr:T9SS type A sorting domain-containing protein [Flavobacterium sp. 102]RKS01443.1 putative secreted protein (Por secretion system target) [Flavobacterium sp. 102]
MKEPIQLFKKLILYTTVLYSYQSIQAQDILWEKSYGGKHADYLFDVIPTPDYGFLLAGSSVSKKTGNKTEENRGDLDYWVWKMDENGELDWQKSFGGSGQDCLKSVLLTSDGGYLLAGSSDSDKGDDKKAQKIGSIDYWIIKLNAKGGEEWQKTLGGLGQDEISCIAKTKDGGYIIGGSSSSDALSQTIIPSAEVEQDIKQEKNTSILKNTPHFGGKDYWVIKLDIMGELVWQKSFGGRLNDELRSITITDDGGFLLGGSSNSPVDTNGVTYGNKLQHCNGFADYWIIMIDKDGNEKWQKVIGGSGDDQLQVVTQTKDGNFIVAGYTNSNSGDDKKGSNEDGTDFWILKLDKMQTILWQETYNVSKVDVLTSLLENDDRSLLIGGYTQGESQKETGAKKSATARKNTKKRKDVESSLAIKRGTGDYVAIKLNENGEELWRREVGSDGQEILSKVIEIRDGSYLMAGTSATPPDAKATGNKSSGIGSQDFWVVKLKDKQKPKEVKQLIEAFPNPTMQYTNVIVNHEFKTGTATVYDIMGRQLQNFVIKDRMVAIDLGNSPEGIYIVEIATNVQKNSVKIVKRN